jgi:DNA-directed RNA polymerase specialized sigma24 family protein
LDTAFLPNSTLAELYRFAWLLAGEAKAAESILRHALEGLEPKLDQLRSAKSKHVWLVRRIRQACLEHAAVVPQSGDRAPRLLREEETVAPGEILEIEAYIVAQHFHGLAEPGRSALALFYLELVPAAEAAELLGLSLEQYCEAVGRARLNLNAVLSDMRAGSAQPA